MKVIILCNTNEISKTFSMEYGKDMKVRIIESVDALPKKQEKQEVSETNIEEIKKEEKIDKEKLDKIKDEIKTTKKKIKNN